MKGCHHNLAELGPPFLSMKLTFLSIKLTFLSINLTFLRSLEQLRRLAGQRGHQHAHQLSHAAVGQPTSVSLAPTVVGQYWQGGKPQMGRRTCLRPRLATFSFAPLPPCEKRQFTPGLPL